MTCLCKYPSSYAYHRGLKRARAWYQHSRKKERCLLTVRMFMRQPVVFGILVFKVRVTLLALLGPEVLKVLLAFFCITKLVLKINTRAILTAIDGPREKTTFQRLAGCSPAARAHRRIASGKEPARLSCQHRLNACFQCLVSPNTHCSLHRGLKTPKHNLTRMVCFIHAKNIQNGK